jgi:hypothetical protein
MKFHNNMGGVRPGHAQMLWLPYKGVDRFHNYIYKMIDGFMSKNLGIMCRTGLSSVAITFYI